MMSAHCADSLNLLMVTQPINSHIIMFSRLATALIHQGHNVSMVLPTNVKHTLVSPDIDLHIYQGVGDENILSSPALSEMLIKIKFASTLKEYFDMFNIDDIVIPTYIEECRILMNDEDLRQKLIAKNFDFAILDNVGFPCLMNYPVSLGLEYFIFSVPLFTWYSQIPDLPSFSPEVYSGKYTDDMTFKERMVNTFYHVMINYMMNSTNPIDMTQYHPGHPIPDLKALQGKALFWFLLNDPSLSFPRPQMPNTVSIGDIMVQEGKSLPDEFQRFLDGAPEGAILVSFGSFLEYIPDDIVEKLCSALAKIPQKIIWKSKTEPPCAKKLKDKMMIASWMPQNDILAHPNLKLFLTHCGLNSMLEAVYHAKPMLGFPIALDQLYNGRILEKKRYGLLVELTDFTSEEVSDKIKMVVGSEDIQKGIKFGSNLLRDKLESPEERVVYWVEHVAKYGAEHLRSGAHKLNLFQFFMIDVMLAYLAIFVVIIVILLCLLYCVWRCGKRCCCGKAKKEKLQ
jgi:hypothetical protein